MNESLADASAISRPADPAIASASAGSQMHVDDEPLVLANYRQA